jgi:hypothetical protein
MSIAKKMQDLEVCLFLITESWSVLRGMDAKLLEKQGKDEYEEV